MTVCYNFDTRENNIQKAKKNMKKIFSKILAAVLMVSTMMTGFTAVAADDAVVLEGKKGIINTPYRLTYEEKTEGDRAFIHFEPDLGQSAVPKADRYGMTIDTSKYKFLKICYRTNCINGQPLHYNILGETPKSIKFYPLEENTWENVIIELNVEEGKKIKQAHFSPFGDSPANSLEGFYTDVEYVAYFATKEEAEAFRKETSGKSHGGNMPEKPVVVAPEIKEEEKDVEIAETLKPAGEPIVIFGEDFVTSKALSDPEKNISYPAELAEDGSMKLVFTRDTTVGKVQFNAGTVKNVEVDKSIYKFIKLRYKYNFKNPDQDYKCMIREGFNGTSTNHNMFPLEKGNDTWHEGIAEITWGTSTEPNVFTFHPVRESAKVSAGDVFYIDYLGFFSSKEDAQAYTGNEEADVSAAATKEHTSYMNGYDNGDGTFSFKPSNTMTRAEACTIVARIKADGDANVTAGTTAFTDVASDKWYFKYITYLENAGLLKSYSGAFTPDTPITRAEFVELVYNLGLVKETDNKPVFNDVDASHARYNVIIASASAGLVNGYDNGDGTFSFKPDNTITRAEVVTVINRALGRNIKSLSVTENYPVTKFTDVDASHWAYGQIAEATTTHNYYSDDKTKTLSYEVWAPKGLKSGNDTAIMLSMIDRLSDERKNGIINSKDELVITGKKYYVSSINGNDANDGLSPETAFASLKPLTSIRINEGDAVLFERGSVFRGHFTARSNCIYGAYGEGEKPRFYGSPYDGAVTGSWVETVQGSNIWLYSEKFAGDVGTIIFDHSEAAIKKCLNEDGLNNVKQNGDFWYDAEKQQVYLYLDKGNPAKVYKSIEFNEKTNIFSVTGGSYDILFDNLSFYYGGSHGIGCGGVTNVHVQNCVFGWIGGSLQNEDARFGNGVEFWAPSVNCSVKNCYVYEVYDAGITFQQKGNGGTDMFFDKIVFDGNLIEKCVYNIEYFSRQYNGNKDIIANTTISNNILRLSGYGWGNQRPDKGGTANIKGWDTKNISSNFVIRDNIIDRGLNHLVHISSFAWDIEKQRLTTKTPQYLPSMINNTFIQSEGGAFGIWNGNSIRFDDKLPYNLIINGCENTNELYIAPKIQ